MPYVYKAAGLELSGLLLQIANAIAAFLLIVLIISIISFFARDKNMVVLRSIIDAIRQIAKGNFNVKLDDDPRKAGHFAPILESINHMAGELGQMEMMRQEFISNVSHELQSPLTSISGFARALQKEGLDERERLHYLQIIEQESVRLSKLSDNLLKLTSLESELQPFEPKRYRLDKQMIHLVLACEPQWQPKELDIDVAFEETYIVADEELMSQVWLNLLHNSIKFTPRGGSIRIELAQEPQQLNILFKDTGIGIANEHLEHVFERFYKSDVSRNKAVGGSGLGLAIVKRIVDLHQGTVRAISEPGEGATIIVALPNHSGSGASGNNGKTGGGGNG
ncbi:HAMP domain-containing sensor histidine kinase [Paenibacillus thalictri]|uniref:Heme sensor protein HssS n=2 Tax=Paenibacillus thalictri TaxID=2527873 RepID=A0A4Q9DZQ2_9BACL|nr:HAMP domain-containing sensor histidine kinase [Paenibacillus thalictri]